MPIYEYQCTRCGHRQEAIQRLDDPPLTVCEECGGELKKLLSAPAFQFKGSGWYVTDYAGKKGGDSGETKKSGGESAASGGDAAKGDAGGSGGDSGKPKETKSDAGATPAASSSKASD